MNEQKSQIRRNTFTGGVKVLPVVLVAIVALFHVITIGWLWGYKPRERQVNKLLEVMQIEIVGPITAVPFKQPTLPSASNQPIEKKPPAIKAPIQAQQKAPKAQEPTRGPQEHAVSKATDTNEAQPMQESGSISGQEVPAVANGALPQPRDAPSEQAAQTAPVGTPPMSPSSTQTPSPEVTIDFGLSGNKRKPPPSRMNYDAFLNGSKVAQASYQLSFSGDELNDFEASFRIRATGLTAWIWRGERIEQSNGKFSVSGFNPERLTQIQGERPARQRDVKRDTTDSVSSVFQLMLLGNNFPDVFVPGFARSWEMQKTSRVDRVRVRIGEPELLQFNGQQVSALPVSFSDELVGQKSADVRTIWFVPALQWLPIRVTYSDGKYDVELRMVGMPAPDVKRAELP